MRVRVVQEFGTAAGRAISKASVIEAYRSRELFEAFDDLPFVGRGTVVKHSPGSDNGPTINHTQWRVELDLPAAARMFVDQDRLSFVEKMELSVDGTGSFVIDPEHYAKLLRASGTTTVNATDGGVQRVTEGKLRVDLGWAGKMFEGDVERAIAGGLTRALHAQVSQVERYIASR